MAGGFFSWGGRERESFHCQRGAKERDSLRELKLFSFLLEEPGTYTVFSSSLIIH